MEAPRISCFSEPECIRLTCESRRDGCSPKTFSPQGAQRHTGEHRENRVSPVFLCAPCGKEFGFLGALAKPTLFRHNTRLTLVAKSYSPHAKNLARSFLDCRQRARSAGAGHYCLTSRRADQCPLARRRRRRDLRGRISLLQPFYFRPSAGARSPARYSGGAAPPPARPR